MNLMYGSKKIELTPETLADAAAGLMALSEILKEMLKETLAEDPELSEEEVREVRRLNEEVGDALMVGIAACEVMTDAMRKREETGADDATAAQ